MTIKIRGQFADVKFEIKGFNAALRAALDKQQREAVKAWLVAVLEEIPTYTGTARGTFAPIGRMVNLTVGKTGILGDPSGAASKKVFKHKGRVIQLGFEEGAELGKDFKLTQEATGKILIYKFEFNHNLPYLIWNNMFPAPEWIHLPSNPPWKALEKGRDAFIEYVTTILLTKVPDPNLFVRISFVKVL